MAKDTKNTKADTNLENRQGMPLFYKNPVPLDSQKHTKWGLKKDFGLGFTKNVNAVPINLIEFPQVCHFYPIAFSPDETATPVAILGLRDNENLFVDDKGNWVQNTYVPAYIRRYPFIFSEMPNTDQLTLCVDANDNIVGEGNEMGFFDEKNKPSALAQNALEFCKSYHAAAQQTVDFGKALHESGLLIERAAEIKTPDNKTINFAGFRIVDEEKLAKMADKDFLEMRSKSWLPFIYAHLFSGAQWQNLTRLLQHKMK